MIGCIIQVRMGSTRLSGKVMKKIDDKNPVLYYVIEQTKYCKLLDKIIIATTVLEEDDIIVKYATNMGIECFRGSVLDVLDRYYQCAKKFGFSTIVRLTSDNPLNDPTITDKAIEKFYTNSYDFLTNSVPRTFPQGISVEVFSFNALEKAWKNARLLSEREHVTPFFYNNPNMFKIYNMEYSENISHLRWTIDRKEDLILVREIISKIKKRPILMQDILELFSKEPDLININKDHIIDEGYLKSLEEDKLFFKSNTFKT